MEIVNAYFFILSFSSACLKIFWKTVQVKLWWDELEVCDTLRLCLVGGVDMKKEIW